MFSILANWRLILAGSLIAVAGFAYVSHLRHALEESRGRAETAQRQATINDATTQATDRVLRETVVIQTKTEKAAANVQQAPGADAPLDPAFRDAWLGGVLDLREGSDDQSPAKPSR
jgi:hypothetical protein